MDYGRCLSFNLPSTERRSLPVNSASRRTRRSLPSTNFTKPCVYPVGKMSDTPVGALRQAQQDENGVRSGVLLLAKLWCGGFKGTRRGQRSAFALVCGIVKVRGK